MTTDPTRYYVEAIDALSFEADLRPDWVVEALKRAGFPDNAATQRLIERLLPEGATLVEPKGLARIHAMASLSDEEREVLPDPIASAEYLCYAIATAGIPIDERAKTLRGDGELIDSMVLDAIALTALNLVTVHLVDRIHTWAKERTYGTSRAFSPGSGRNQWDLPNQKFVFARVPGELADVRLTPSYLMLPTKSLSFVVGIGPDIPHVKDPFSCAGCPRVDCEYRHEVTDEMIASV